MLRLPSIGIALVAYCAIAASLAAAVAPNKLGYEQKWAKCESHLDKTVPGDQQTVKASFASSCMLKYGNRI